MKEYVFTELGYFRKQTCEKIKKDMDGKTLIICTDYEDTEENIKNFFLHCALEALAR